jgi:plastocyanin
MLCTLAREKEVHAMMRFTRPAGLLAAVVLLLLSLAQALHAGAAVPAARLHAMVQVTIQNFAFSPQTITIAPGTTVVWTQKDSVAHTVTSDTGAWTDSGTLAQNKTFSVTFTKPGTYPYHCAIHPSMIAKVIVTSGNGMTGGTTMGAGMGSMGPMSKASLPAWTGYYDGHKVLYVSTDTSSKAEALAAHINYAPGLVKTLSLASKIYLVTNGMYASRGPAFGSEPGESDYTPLWQEVLVTWKDPSKAVFLGSDNDVNAMAKAGKVTLKMTGTVLNCPIIKVLGTS